MSLYWSDSRCTVVVECIRQCNCTVYQVALSGPVYLQDGSAQDKLSCCAPQPPTTTTHHKYAMLQPAVSLGLHCTGQSTATTKPRHRAMHTAVIHVVITCNIVVKPCQNCCRCYRITDKDLYTVTCIHTYIHTRVNVFGYSTARSTACQVFGKLDILVSLLFGCRLGEPGLTHTQGLGPLMFQLASKVETSN